jgi:TctA family transporter
MNSSKHSIKMYVLFILLGFIGNITLGILKFPQTYPINEILIPMFAGMAAYGGVKIFLSFFKRSD